jgi:hypothetical protein
MAGSNFDALLEELTLLNKADGPWDTSDDDERIARAAEEEEDQAKPRLTSSHLAVLNAFGQVQKVVIAQAKAIKDLTARVEALEGGGKPMQKALRAGGKVDGQEFLAKSLAAQTAGRISATDVAIAETHINAGKQPPAYIVHAVLTDS